MSELLQTTSEMYSSKNESKNSNKNKVSKMKCSICKQDGDNQCSCEKNTAQAMDEQAKVKPITKDEAEKSEDECKYLKDNNLKLLLEIAAETTSILSGKQEHLQQCKWTDGESNTDTEFSELACKCAEEAWICIKQRYPLLNMITMTASIPDINCVFSKNGKTIKDLKTKIELKSSKSHVMPGSTIGKLDINQPLIYCYRPKNADTPYEIRYGQYHTAMGESDTDLFQDRTPRPQLNFTKLSRSSQMEVIYSNKEKDAWISHYAKCAVTRLTSNVSYSWQDTFTKNVFHESLQALPNNEPLQNILSDALLNNEALQNILYEVLQKNKEAKKV
jgi:hypothetical protein